MNGIYKLEVGKFMDILSNNMFPEYFSKLFRQSSSLHSYSTRSVGYKSLVITRLTRLKYDENGTF